MAGYYPHPCALDKIVNATIAACDPLDGRTDGVISRSDLYKLNFNLSGIVGETYYCAATTSSSLGFGSSKRQEGSISSTTPEQWGTVTAEDVAIAQAVYDALFYSKGERAYLSWQIGAELSDAATIYDNTTGSWGLSIPSTGGLYVRKFVELLDLDNLDNFDGITNDQLVHWMNIGFKRFYDSLQTTYTELNPFKETGGKLIHYHGESDPSIPAGSPGHYRQAVRNNMYYDLSDEEAEAALDDWY